MFWRCIIAIVSAYVELGQNENRKLRVNEEQSKMYLLCVNL